MKVLHIIGGKLTGGAARGAYWLHLGLRELGLESSILANSKQTLGDPLVVSLARTLKGKALNKLSARVDELLCALYAGRIRGGFSTGLVGVNFTKTRACREADIVHLHWVNEGMVNIRHLSRCTKPIIWTMRDMWPMTGGCHYSMKCERYHAACGRCPHLGSRYDRDLSRYVWKRKKRHMPESVKMVGISRWLTDCARKSALLRDFDIRTIPNNINTRDFFPIEKHIARNVLGLPLDRAIVLAGAQRLDDGFKGFETYLKAIAHLTADPLLLFFGNLDHASIAKITRDHVHLGFLHDAVLLRLAYSAADVFAAPTHMDAFGKTLAEAMACGTPGVCFDAAGPRDIVDHLENGYRATPYDPEDFARGIDWVLGHPDPEGQSRKARDKVLREFDCVVAARNYLQLYSEMLE